MIITAAQSPASSSCFSGGRCFGSSGQAIASILIKAEFANQLSTGPLTQPEHVSRSGIAIHVSFGVIAKGVGHRIEQTRAGGLTGLPVKTFRDPVEPWLLRREPTARRQLRRTGSSQAEAIEFPTAPSCMRIPMYNLVSDLGAVIQGDEEERLFLDRLIQPCLDDVPELALDHGRASNARGRSEYMPVKPRALTEPQGQPLSRHAYALDSTNSGAATGRVVYIRFIGEGVW